MSSSHREPTRWARIKSIKRFCLPSGECCSFCDVCDRGATFACLQRFSRSSFKATEYTSPSLKCTNETAGNFSDAVRQMKSDRFTYRNNSMGLLHTGTIAVRRRRWFPL